MKLIASKFRTTSNRINPSTVYSRTVLKVVEEAGAGVFWGLTASQGSSVACLTSVSWTHHLIGQWSGISSPWLSVISPSLVHDYSLSNVKLTYPSHYDANHLLSMAN